MDRPKWTTIKAGDHEIPVEELTVKGRLAFLDPFAILVVRLVELPICDSYARPVAYFPRLANAAGRFHL